MDRLFIMSATLDHFPALAHDHDACVKGALDLAENSCERQGARLTALRRRVLELVWGSHAPVGAYALLDQLKQEGHGAAPPTVYRSLDFLLEHGLIHRLERLNAYVGCSRPTTRHVAQFLICTTCSRAVELDDPAIDAAVLRRAQALGFSVARQTIEVEGLCPACQSTDSVTP
jgi:Fur family zinc uptake transcriptional regulator